MTIYSLDILLSALEPVCCSMSSSNCCFLTCIQISQEAGQVVWYSHFFQNFPEFVVVHTVKGFVMFNKAEVDVFKEYFAFSMIQWIFAVWSLVPLTFLNPAWISWSSWFMYCWSLAWRILSITLLCLVDTIGFASVTVLFKSFNPCKIYYPKKFFNLSF